jgi:hypothetical protein
MLQTFDAISPVDGPDARFGQQIREDEAVEIWIARWLRMRRKDILARYGCDPRRLYDIWEGKRFPASRDKALALFTEKWPELLDRVDTSPHRRMPRPGPDESQMGLFPSLPPVRR